MFKSNKILIMALVIMLLLTPIANVYANDLTLDSKQNIRLILEQKREAIYEDTKRQLIGQDAIAKFPLFKDIIDAQFDAMLKEHNNDGLNLNSSRQSIRLPDGCEIVYDTSGAEVYQNFFNEEQTDRLRDAAVEGGSISGDFLLELFGNYDQFGFIPIFSLIRSLQEYSFAQGWKKINNGTRCAWLIVSYDTYDLSTTKVFTEWTDYPYVTINANASNLRLYPK